MTFQKDLFLEICRKYGVQFSGAYDTLMLNDNGCIKELHDEDVERIMLPSDVISCSVSECTDSDITISIPQETSHLIDFVPDNLLVAA